MFFILFMNCENNSTSKLKNAIPKTSWSLKATWKSLTWQYEKLASEKIYISNNIFILIPMVKLEMHCHKGKWLALTHNKRVTILIREQRSQKHVFCKWKFFSLRNGNVWVHMVLYLLLHNALSIIYYVIMYYVKITSIYNWIYPSEDIKYVLPDWKLASNLTREHELWLTGRDGGAFGRVLPTWGSFSCSVAKRDSRPGSDKKTLRAKSCTDGLSALFWLNPTLTHEAHAVIAPFVNRFAPCWVFCLEPSTTEHFAAVGRLLLTI